MSGITQPLRATLNIKIASLGSCAPLPQPVCSVANFEAGVVMGAATMFIPPKAMSLQDMICNVDPLGLGPTKKTKPKTMSYAQYKEKTRLVAIAPKTQ